MDAEIFTESFKQGIKKNYLTKEGPRNRPKKKKKKKKEEALFGLAGCPHGK